MLFMVDRRNLGKQACDEFLNYITPRRRTQVRRHLQHPAAAIEHDRPSSERRDHDDAAPLPILQGEGEIRRGD